MNFAFKCPRDSPVSTALPSPAAPSRVLILFRAIRFVPAGTFSHTFHLYRCLHNFRTFTSLLYFPLGLCFGRSSIVREKGQSERARVTPREITKGFAFQSVLRAKDALKNLWSERLGERRSQLEATLSYFLPLAVALSIVFRSVLFFFLPLSYLMPHLFLRFSRERRRRKKDEENEIGRATKVKRKKGKREESPFIHLRFSPRVSSFLSNSTSSSSPSFYL